MREKSGFGILLRDGDVEKSGSFGFYLMTDDGSPKLEMQKNA